MQFLDKVDMPVVMQDSVSGLDVQKTVDVPQPQFLTLEVAMPAVRCASRSSFEAAMLQCKS